MEKKIWVLKTKGITPRSKIMNLLPLDFRIQNEFISQLRNFGHDEMCYYYYKLYKCADSCRGFLNHFFFTTIITIIIIKNIYNP